jgi:hypothetical protein
MPIKTSVTKIVELSGEVRAWLELQFHKPILTEDIYNTFKTSFPWAKIPYEEILHYREEIVPDFESLLPEKPKPIVITAKVSELELDLYEELATAPVDENEFEKDERKKLNMLHSYRIVLRETWDNYKNVKDGDDEQAKAKYLDLLPKILSKIEEFITAEKSFLSAISEVKKAEESMTIKQCMDSIMGWFIPRAAEKGKDKNEILEYIFMLQMMLNLYTRFIMVEPDMEHANRELLEALYDPKEVRKIA